MKKYFVIGNPINHSLSPKLHNYWLKENNIDAIYDKKKIDEKDLQTTILEIKEKKTEGINVTVPFKKSVIPYLDKLSPEAEQTQSVNTIILNDDILVGHNTDISGFIKAIKDLNFNIEGTTPPAPKIKIFLPLISKFKSLIALVNPNISVLCPTKISSVNVIVFTDCVCSASGLNLSK